MDYDEAYYKIFAHTRVLLGLDIEEKVKFIKRSIQKGDQRSIAFLNLVADSLTAYNEICPYPEFISTRFFS